MKDILDRWRQRAQQLKRETYALYLAYRDPRVPWYAKALAACVVAYAFSPLDLIPDFIPVLGYLDDLVLIPAGIAVALKMIPSPVMAECRARAAQQMAEKQPRNWLVGALIVALWLSLLALSLVLVVRALRG